MYMLDHKLKILTSFLLIRNVFVIVSQARMIAVYNNTIHVVPPTKSYTYLIHRILSVNTKPFILLSSIIQNNCGWDLRLVDIRIN